MLRELLHRIVSIPRVYDTVQKLAGRDRIYRWLAPCLADYSGRKVLDVGGGTGELARIVPRAADYIWLDNDAQKLKGVRQKIKKVRAVLGDASQIGLKDKCVDVGVCVAVSHHLTDPQLADMLSEIGRVCRSRLIFVDAIRHQTSPLSNLLWRYDRGSYPRTAEQLRSCIERYFRIESEARNAVYHHYWLCVATPRTDRGIWNKNLPFLVMQTANLREIAPDLELGQDGWWISRKLSQVSYPEHGNALCFSVEDSSFWFAHRNRCILQTIELFPPPGALFDVGGGNGYVARAIQDAGLEVVLVEPGLAGVRNAVKRGIGQVVRATVEDAGCCQKLFPRWACSMLSNTSVTTRVS